MTEKFATDNYFSNHNDDDIDLGKIFRFILMQSKIIIGITVSAFFVSYILYSTSTKQYEIKSLLEYEAFNQSVFDPSDALQLSRGSTSDISNMIELYESRTNYVKVIKDLKLNIRIPDLNDDESIDIEITADGGNPLEGHLLKFIFNEDGYSLMDENSEKIKLSKYGEKVNYKNLSIAVNASNLTENRPIDIYYRHPEAMYSSFKAMMRVNSLSERNSFFRNEGLITISYITDDTELGKKIVDYANSIFLSQRIYDETEKSRKAIEFIDKNIKSIETAVETNKIRLKEFREKNKSIDVSLEIEAIINNIQNLEKALSNVDLELARAEEIYTANNPIYLNLMNEKMLIERQKADVLAEVEMMPKEQQEYIDLFNSLEVSQALFEELESRRLGFSILEASTIGDVRVVDSAYVNTLVSPTVLSIILFTVVFFVLACFFAIMRGFYFLPISNPAELFDNNIHLPVIGVIPQISFDDNEVPDSTDDELKLNSSLESLIVSINAIKDNDPNKKIITITSPSPGNGKSTLSRKLAEAFAKINQKVLLVDNDLKRGKIAEKYNIKSISENTFNSIDETTIDKYRIRENLYLIPRVKGLSNSFQFLYSSSYSEKIKFFKESFDFVIFDTGPILSVADSSILIEKSDFNVLVARHGINKINEIKQCVANFDQINKDIDGIVYNAYAKPKSYYGYYGIYGNYSYQYYAEKYLDDTYEYKKED